MHLKPNLFDLINQVKPQKDIDGMTDYNISALINKRSNPFFISSTGLAVMKILNETGIRLAGKKCALLNKGSRSVGIPLQCLLEANDVEVTRCDSNSDLESIIRESDIVIAALGKHNLIKGEWIKPGSVVIDLGTNFLEVNNKIRMVGDIPFQEVKFK